MSANVAELPQAGPQVVLDMRTYRHVLEALRSLSYERCYYRNCGTVCLCGPCHAKAALAVLDPEWHP
jgi:ferredoxin